MTRTSSRSVVTPVALLLLASACYDHNESPPSSPKPEEGAPAATGAAGDSATMQLTSPSFSNDGAIPSQFTCEGAGIGPALRWSGAPAGTKSLALIVDDPDAPKGTFVHWVVYDLPAQTTGLPEGGALPKGARTGINGFKKSSWGGPCPPSGRHRYFFKLYALDAELGDLGEASKAQLEKAMEGHILAKGVLMGTYQKKK